MFNTVKDVLKKIDYRMAVKTKKLKVNGVGAEIRPFTRFKAFTGEKIKEITYLSEDEFKDIENEELMPLNLKFEGGSEIYVLAGCFTEEGEIAKKAKELDENARKSGTNEFVIKKA